MSLLNILKGGKQTAFFVAINNVIYFLTIIFNGLHINVDICVIAKIVLP